MKKYIICSFCFLVIICSVYIHNFNKLYKYTISEKNTISVNISKNTIKSNAILITESMQINPNGKNELLRNQTTMPSIYLGMTRNDVQNHLTEYMDNLSINDLENGLIQFELIYFSSNCMVLRKTYDTNENYHKYFIKFYKGCVTVFYSDQKTVYEYTNISLTSLPPNIAANIITGLKIKDEKALFDFLENYSS